MLRLLALTAALVQAGACGDGRLDVSVERDGLPVLALRAERAITAEERRRGLRGRPSLGDSDGLLIELPVVTEVCIVNSGVTFDIDATYADGEGLIVAIEREIVAGDGRARCHDEVLDVLETAAGVASDVEVGDRLVIPGRP